VGPSGVVAASLDQSRVVVESAGQEPQVHDGACRLLYEVDDFRYSRGIRVAGNHDGTRNHDRRIASLVEKGPYKARLVLVVQIGGDVHGDYDCHLLGRGEIVLVALSLVGPAGD
jgi:hypothetical protein